MDDSDLVLDTDMETSIFDVPWVSQLLGTTNKTVIEDGQNTIQCSNCSQTFYNQVGAAFHERKCLEGSKPYKCGHCGKRFQMYITIRNHMAKHAKEEEQLMLEATNTYTDLEEGEVDLGNPGDQSETLANVEESVEDEDEEEDDDPYGQQPVPPPNLDSDASSDGGGDVIPKQMSQNGDYEPDVIIKEEASREPFDIQQPSQSNCNGDQSGLGMNQMRITNLSNHPSVVDHDFAEPSTPKIQDTSGFYNGSSENNDITPAPSPAPKKSARRVRAPSPSDAYIIKLDLEESYTGGRRRRHMCKVCGQRFYRRKHIKKHIELHEEETLKIFKCPQCNLWFGCPQMVETHKADHHVTDSKVAPKVKHDFLKRLLVLLAKEGNKGKIYNYISAKETKKDKKFECEICSKRFTSFYRVRKHKVMAHEELMSMMEDANEAMGIPLDDLRESNILALLSHLKDMEEMDAARERAASSTQGAGAVVVTPGLVDAELGVDYANLGIPILPKLPPIPPAGIKIIPRAIEPNNMMSGPGMSNGMSLSAINIVPAIDDPLLMMEPPSQQVRFVLTKAGTNIPQNGFFIVPQGSNPVYQFTGEANSRGRKKGTSKPIEQHYEEEESPIEEFVPFDEMTPQQVAEGMKQCQLCGKLLSSKTNMKIHMQSHSGERNNECKWCGKRYTLSATLKRHEKIHTNDRPFKCNLCPKAYTQASNLKRHYRQHTGERPFLCSFCPRTYAEKFSLTRHLRKHSEAKAYRCRVCNRHFAEDYQLIRHKRVAHRLRK